MRAKPPLLDWSSRVTISLKSNVTPQGKVRQSTFFSVLKRAGNENQKKKKPLPHYRYGLIDSKVHVDVIQLL